MANPPDRAAATTRRDLDALTIDVWYTLLYLPTAERLRLERSRARAWCDPLVVAGVPRSRAEREFRALVDWDRTQEAMGHTPSLPAQTAWMVRRTGVSLSREVIQDRLDRALRSSAVRVAPGAHEVLGRLADEGIGLGVVSNVLFESGEAARGVLASTGLLPRMQAVVLSCELPWAKPRPEPFRRCLRTLKVAPAAAGHVGDLRVDVDGARRAGLAPILYTGLHRWETPRPRFAPEESGFVRIARWSELLTYPALRRDREPRRGNRSSPPCRPLRATRRRGSAREMTRP